MKKYLVTLTLFLFVTVIITQAQAPIITTPYPAPAQGLTRGLDQGILTTQVAFTAACTGTTVTLGLAPGINYVPGSVVKTGGSGVTITIAESNISNLNRPVFSLSGITGSGDITFTVLREAGCGNLTSAKDTIRVTGSCGSTIENSASINTYNLLAPVFSLTPPAAISNALVGQTANRTTTVTNGGNGCADTVRFYLVYPNAGIVNTNSNKITVSGNNFNPWRTNGDTLFYKIFGATLFGGDNLFCNGESITITEPIKIAKCNITTTYAAYWSKTQSPGCQTVSGTSATTMITGVANFSNTPLTTRSNFTDFCHPFNYSTTFNNTGTGNAIAASMYNVKVSVESYFGGNFNSILNACTFSNFKVNGNNITASGSNTTTYTVDFTNLFTTDPDGAGVGLEDTDGDGFFDDLPSGNTLSLVWQVNPVCNIACNNPAQIYIGYRLLYQDMCSNSITSSIKASLIPLSEAGFGSTSYVPANIVGGTPFRFKFGTSFFSNTNDYVNSNSRYKYILILPTGVSVSGTGNPKYGTTTVSYTISSGASGDTLIITSPNNVLDSAGVDLVYTCGSSGTINFDHSLLKIQDITTFCACNGLKYCATITSKTQCPLACIVGPSNYLPTVRRVDNSLGWTDQTLATRQSAANISAYDLSKALYMDTIQITGGAKQNNAAANIHLRLSLPKTSNPAIFTKLNPLNIAVEIWRSGVKITNCSITSFTDSSTATMQKVDWDLCVPAGGLLPGDSIYSLSKYVVATNNGLDRYDLQSGNEWYYYNKVGTQMDYCGNFIPEMYLVGTQLVIGANSFVSPTCSSFIPGNNFANIARRFSNTGQTYVNEYRPMAYIDSVVFIKTAGYDYMSAVLYKNASPHGTTGALNLTPDLVSGNKYTFINPGTWPFFEISKENSYGGAFMPTLSSNCATLAADNLETRIYIKDYYYAFGNIASVPSAYQYIMGSGGTMANIAGATTWIQPITYPVSIKPALSVQNNTGIVQGILPQHYWDVQVNSTGTTTASYVWFAIEKGNGSGDISIDSVVLKPSNTVLNAASVYNGGTDKWYKYSTAGLTSGSSTNARVYFKYTSCTKDSILFKTSWNCTGYPNPDPTVSICTGAQAYLVVDPAISQIQLSVARQPGGGSTIPLCTTDSILVNVNSAQSAYLVAPYVNVTSPTGVTLQPPFAIEYPAGSGIYQNAVSTAIPGGYKIDLTGHTGIGTNGIPGTISNPGAAGRVAKIKIPFTTDCSITSGSPIQVVGYGNQPCGSLATGSGSTLQTAGVNITGASTSGGAGLTLNLPVSSLDCGQVTTLSLNSTPVITPTQTGDTIIYTLPVGINYAGNFTGGTNCAACTSTTATDPAGNTLVKIKLQTGVAAGSTLTYSFDISPAGGGSCGSITIGAAAKRDIPALMCGTSACTSSSVIIGTATSSPITINKPKPTLTNVHVVGGAKWTAPGGTATVAVSITNNGTLAMAANTYAVEFFCGASTTPFTSVLFPNTIAIGASSTANLVVTTGPGCTNGQYVTAKIRPNATSGAQCICDSTSLVILSALPTKLRIFNVVSQGCAAVLNWVSENEFNASYFDIEISSDGVTFASVNKIAATAINGSSKAYQAVVPQNVSILFYRLKIVDKTGLFTYSDVLSNKTNCSGTESFTVYPNPVTNGQLFLMIASNYKGAVTARITNSVGQQVTNKEIEINTGANIIPVSINNIASGTYFITIEKKNREKIGESQRVVKM